MAAPVAVAAEAPVLAELLIDLMVLLGWLVCLGLLWAWRHTIGAALRTAAGALDFKVLGKSIPLGAPLRELDDVVTSNLGAYANATHRAVGYFWNQAAQLQTWVGDEIAGIAEDTYGWATWLQHVHLPKWAKYAALAGLPAALLAKLIAAEVRRVLPHVGKVAAGAATRVEVILDRPAIKRLEGEIADLRHWVVTRPAAVAATVTGAGAAALPNVHIFPRLHALDLARLRHNKRIKRLEKIFAAAGAAAIMANALGLPNWRCITRGNLGRASRAICGLESGLFAALLAGLVIFETPLSIEELAHEYLEVFDEVLGFVTGAVSELEGIV
jgi:hypothetical protein